MLLNDSGYAARAAGSMTLVDKWEGRERRELTVRLGAGPKKIDAGGGVRHGRRAGLTFGHCNGLPCDVVHPCLWRPPNVGPECCGLAFRCSFS